MKSTKADKLLIPVTFEIEGANPFPPTHRVPMTDWRDTGLELSPSSYGWSSIEQAEMDRLHKEAG